MKKLFDLQMFAEEVPENESGAIGETTENNSNKPGNDPNAPKYTDADVNRMFGQKFAEWKQKEERDRAKAEESAREAARLAQMTAEEKSNERIRQLEERLAAADRREALAAMTKQARAMLQDKNISVGDELISNLISEDADTTKAAVESFISAYNAAVERAVKEALKGESPKAGTSPAGLTKEQILAIPNRAERQAKMKEHKDLF